MNKTEIEWCDMTWNPVSGCSHVSEGCRNCYAKRLFPRVYGKDRISVPAPAGGVIPENYLRPTGPPYIWQKARHFTDVVCHPDRLEQPLKIKKPQKIFVNSMSDLFHEDVPDGFIDQVFETICMCRGRHTFQILTKRPSRMLTWCKRAQLKYPGWFRHDGIMDLWQTWLGVSVEDQPTADERIPILLQTPAAVRWISAEPLLGPIDLVNYLWMPDPHKSPADFLPTNSLNWAIVGGESGPKARPMHPDWARSIRDQCQAAQVPFFFKQWGEWRHGYSHNPIRRDWEGISIERVGKKEAGHLLDGRVWQEFPA